MENGILEVKTSGEPDAEWLKLNITKGRYIESYSDPIGNLYCMSLFAVEEGCFNIPERCKGFGGHFVLIRNQPEFMKRIESVLNNLNIGFCKGGINYLDLKAHTGEKTVYQKDIAYAYQEEYRIHIHRNTAGDFKFFIGSIEDIASLHSFNETQKIIVRTRPDAEKQTSPPLPNRKS